MVAWRLAIDKWTSPNGIRKVLRTWVRGHSVRESREQSIRFLDGDPSNLREMDSVGFQSGTNLVAKGRR